MPQAGKRNGFLGRSAPKLPEMGLFVPKKAKIGRNSTPAHQLRTPVGPASTSVGLVSTSAGYRQRLRGLTAPLPLRSEGGVACPADLAARQKKGSPRRAAHYPLGGFVSLASREAPFRCRHCATTGFPSLPSARRLRRSAAPASQGHRLHPATSQPSRLPPNPEPRPPQAPFPAPSALRPRLVPSRSLPLQGPASAPRPPPVRLLSAPSLPLADEYVNASTREAQRFSRPIGPETP